MSAATDPTAIAAAEKIADQARRGSTNLNVNAVVLGFAHPDAPPGGQWSTIALCKMTWAACDVARKYEDVTGGVPAIVLMYTPQGWVNVDWKAAPA